MYLKYSLPPLFIYKRSNNDNNEKKLNRQEGRTRKPYKRTVPARPEGHEGEEVAKRNMLQCSEENSGRNKCAKGSEGVKLP